MSTDAAAPEVSAPATADHPTGREVIYRHARITRITHWVNVIVLSLLLMSGLNIFDAHPRLYWGAAGADNDKPWLEMTARDVDSAKPVGVLRIAGHEFRTTGVLGVSPAADGSPEVRGFPRWVTLPNERNLSMARRWHFFLAWIFVANGLVYLLFGIFNGHFRKDFAPRLSELTPRHILASIVDHIKLKHPVGEEAKRFNILQKFAYIAVVFVLLPVMILTGLTMSPGVDAAVPWLLDLFGGRQSARGIHFITANLIVLFVIVHLVEVVIAGAANEIGSMITGRYTIKTGHDA